MVLYTNTEQSVQQPRELPHPETAKNNTLPQSLQKLSSGKLSFPDVINCAKQLLPITPDGLASANKDQYYSVLELLQSYLQEQLYSANQATKKYTPVERSMLLTIQHRLTLQQKILERKKLLARSRRRFLTQTSACTVSMLLLGLSACLRKKEGAPIPQVTPATAHDPEATPTTNSPDAEFTREVQPQLVHLDERIGVSHIAGLYPQTGREFLADGVEMATQLGFSSLEVEISPRVICGTHPDKTRYPHGVYQFTGFCPSDPERVTILDVAQSSEFGWVFQHPQLKHLVVTTEAGLPESATAWNISHQPLTEQQLQSTYNEFFDFVSHLLRNYGHLDKEIIIQTPNELDWHMLEAQGGWAARELDASELAVANAIKYLNTIHRAIADAKSQNPNTQLQLTHSVEVNRVQDARYEKVRAATAVIPQLDFTPDYIGYSAYDTILEAGLTAFSRAFEYLQVTFPHSKVFISELGVPHGPGSYTPEDAKKLVREATAAALAAHAAFVFYWQLLDNECSVPEPEANQCRGFWIVDPKGNLSPVYTDVFAAYSLDD